MRVPVAVFYARYTDGRTDVHQSRSLRRVRNERTVNQSLEKRTPSKTKNSTSDVFWEKRQLVTRSSGFYARARIRIFTKPNSSPARQLARQAAGERLVASQIFNAFSPPGITAS